MSDVVNLKDRKTSDDAAALLKWINDIHAFAGRQIDRIEALGSGRDAMHAFMVVLMADLGKLAAAMSKMGVPSELITRVSITQMMLTVVSEVTYVDAPAWGSPAVAEKLRARLVEGMNELTLTLRGER